MRDDIIKKAKRFMESSAKKAAKVSGDALDYTKLKIKLYDLHDKIDLKYAEIGRTVYEENEETDIEALCNEVAELKQLESEIKLKISSYQNKKECCACGEKVDAKAEYCPLCGNKF